MFSTALPIWFLLACSCLSRAGRTNFRVKKFELLGADPHVITFHGNITTEGDNQYISFNITTAISWGDNVDVVVPIESLIIGNTYAELFVIREKNACKAANSFLGEFWYDILRGVQITPGVCPLRSGKYHGQHILLDFNKMSVQAYPLGTLRFTINLIDNRSNNAVISSLRVEVENRNKQ